MGDEYAFANFADYQTVVEKIYAEHGLAYEGGYGQVLQGMHAIAFTERERILLKCLDENIAFFSLIAFKCAANAAHPGIAARAATNLLASTASSLRAIHNLSSAGLVAAGLQLCRPLRETTNVLVLCRVDDGFAQAFAATTTAKVANAFWYQRIARSKDVKAIEAAATNPSIVEGALRGFLKGIDEHLGAMIHPSHLAASIARHADLYAVFGMERSAPIAGAPVAFALSQCFKLYVCLFEKSLVGARAINELVPATDQPIVASMHKALLELYLFTMTRIGASALDSSSVVN